MATSASSENAKIARMGPALERVSGVLERLARQGLQRVTAGSLREIQAVAQTAQHARLVRLQRELESMSSMIGRYMERDPSFRPSQFVAVANRIWLLVGETRRALASAPDLAALEPITGVPRRRYEEVHGPLDVECVGAAGWVTESGFVGVTAHLWSAATDRMLEAAMVRPDSLVGRDPTRLLTMGFSDVTPLTIQELCHGAWTLDGVRLSSDGRVSLHGGLSISPGPRLGRAALEPLAVPSADAILDRLAARELHPVSGVGTLLVLIEPVAFGMVRVDETHARATSHVRDQHGAVLSVSVQLRPENDVLIDNLEKLRGAWAPDGLIAEASLWGRTIRLRPLSAVYASPVSLGRRVPSTHLVHLTVESLERARR